MRILVDENIPQGENAFAPYGQVQRFAGRNLRRSDLDGCEALIVRSITRVNAELLNGSPVRFVGTATIGTDHVDQAWLREKGIAFASAPGCNANSVAEYVTAALLELQAEAGLTLPGAILGIVGYGNVGKQVKKKAEALGMSVLLCDPLLQEQGFEEDFNTLSEVLRFADILSLHVPLTETGPHATRNLFHGGRLAELQRPITLINTSRGEITDEAALLDGKRLGKLKHLVLDVFPAEPTPNRSLWKVCDLISPHIAGYSLQGKLGGTQQVLEAFCKALGFIAPEPRSEPLPDRPLIDFSTLPADVLLASAQSPWALVRHAVRHAYPLRIDDRALRTALKTIDPGEGFDRLRRDYPIRHEFSRYEITHTSPEQEPALEILQSLGFGVV
jgi:erythronate-4-phosphate dehydrogenase